MFQLSVPKWGFHLAIIGVSLLPLEAISDEIGRTEFDGREIILKDDFTWEYAGKETSECTLIESGVLPISVCLSEKEWSFFNLGTSFEFELKMKNKDLFLLIITEKEDQDLNEFRMAIINNAQTAAGLNKVNVLDEGNVIIDSHDSKYIIYQAKIDGENYTYHNYYANFGQKGAFQFVFFVNAREYEEVLPSIKAAEKKISIGN
jgi:hypothetical protein